MGFFHGAKNAGPTEHTAREPGADSSPSTGTTRALGDATRSASNSRDGEFVAESKIIGPNVPVAGDATGDGERSDASSNAINCGPVSANTEKGALTQLDGHATGSVKGGGDEKGDGGEEVEDESKYPRGVPLAILTFGLCMATFVVSRWKEPETRDLTLMQ